MKVLAKDLQAGQLAEIDGQWVILTEVDRGYLGDLSQLVMVAWGKGEDNFTSLSIGDEVEVAE